MRTALVLDYNWTEGSYDAVHEAQMYLDTFFNYPERIQIEGITECQQSK